MNKRILRSCRNRFLKFITIHIFFPKIVTGKLHWQWGYPVSVKALMLDKKRCRMCKHVKLYLTFSSYGGSLGYHFIFPSFIWNMHFENSACQDIVRFTVFSESVIFPVKRSLLINTVSWFKLLGTAQRAGSSWNHHQELSSTVWTSGNLILMAWTYLPLSFCQYLLSMNLQIHH